MKIDLNKLVECPCGVILNYEIMNKKITFETNFQKSKIYEIRCPVCKKKLIIPEKP